jgi:hypothetical protein
MLGLANSYSALGRHQEAVEMREKTLEFFRRVLPENHPDIGEGDAAYGGARVALHA